MIHVSIFIVIDVQEDSEGYVCPCFFDEETLLAEYPDSKYIEVEIDNFNIGLN